MSAIPQPTSAMKRSNPGGTFGVSHVRSVSASRHSLAPTRSSQPLFSRSSSGVNLGEKRASYQNSKPTGSLIIGESDRRSSAHPSRPSTAGSTGYLSFFQSAPQASGAPRDPRPLRDRSFQARIGQELLDYLARNNFDIEMKYTLSHNVIKSPTQKDFNYMFQWLYHRIDPSYRFAKNMDHEVPHILKQLRYPYERTITKSQIAAVGGQNWGTFLGLLHWLMQLTRMLDGYTANQYDNACLQSGIDVNGDHIMFEYLSRGYRDWLNMDDDAGEDEVDRVLAPHVDAMARAFEQANSRYIEELEVLESEKLRLEREMEDLQNATPDPAVLDSHFRIMEEDRAKFEQYNVAATQRSEKYESRTSVLEEELAKLVEETHAVVEERRSLQKAVDDQGISLQDIDRMTAERERLQRGTESAAQRLEDVKSKVADKELEASRKLDELSRLVDMHNTLAYQIGMIPPTAVNANGNDYDLRVMPGDAAHFGGSQQQLHSGERLLVDASIGYQPGHILNLDLRGKVKHEYIKLRKDISERRGVAIDVMMKDHELLDGIKEAIEDKRNEVEALEHRVRAAEAEYENTREITMAQKLASDTQIEKMEKELSKMRAGLAESVQLMEQREMNTSIEYEQLVLRANTLREELHTEIDRMLNDVIKFKIHVQKNLEEYENFVTDELERELRSSDETRTEG